MGVAADHAAQLPDRDLFTGGAQLVFGSAKSSYISAIFIPLCAMDSQAKVSISSQMKNWLVSSHILCSRGVEYRAITPKG
jgi:hypothetical protein